MMADCVVCKERITTFRCSSPRDNDRWIHLVDHERTYNHPAIPKSVRRGGELPHGSAEAKTRRRLATEAQTEAAHKARLEAKASKLTEVQKRQAARRAAAIQRGKRS